MTAHESEEGKVTGGFKESLFTIERDGKVFAVIAATNAQVAIGRSDAIRHIVPLPRRELLEARFLEQGPVQAPYFAGGYFKWLDSLDCPEDSCPICGR